MEMFSWVVLVIAAFGFGAALEEYLTVHPLRMSRYLFVATMLLAGILAGVAWGFDGWQRLAAAAAALAVGLASYTLMTRRFLAREDDRPVPAITRAKGDPSLGHTAVVYFTHGEPETYDPIGWINQFREFDEQKIPFVPLLVRPLFAYQLRKKYLAVGRSNHRQTHVRMIHKLAEAYRAQGDHSTRFYLSFLDDNPRPDAAAIQALNDGASRIVVAEVFLTLSNHTAEGEELIKALALEDYGIDVRYTGPLWDSDTLKRMFVQRANAWVDGIDKSQVGVLLVGHGQPDEWDVEWATETEQELEFRHAVLRNLVADGFKPENVALAWMEFKEPKPAAKVEEFANNGVKRLLYFSAAISADALHSQIDVPELIEKARVPVGFPMVNLGAWNDDPLVIQAIKERVDDQMASKSN
jgi:sirohydrochlorin ferrochelatase